MAGKKRREPCLQRRPGTHIILRGRVHISKTELVQQQLVELRLQRAQGNEAAVGATIDIIEWRVVERAGGRSIQLPAGTYPLRDAAEHRQYINDRAVHHAPTAA